MRKLAKKGNGGGMSIPTSKSVNKTVSKNPEGTLKTVTKTYTGGNKEGEISRTRRTIKGINQAPERMIVTPQSKSVTKSPSGNYKTVTKTFNDDNKKGTISTTRRTIKGVINKARPVADVKAILKNRDSNIKADFANYYKKGGVTKTKTKK